jgi:ADP-heptose:LPS heptosyltransferase
MLDLMREHFERTLNLHVTDDEWKLSLRPNERGLASIDSAVASVLSAHGTKGYVQVHLEAKDAFHELGLEGSLALSRELTALHPDRSVLWTASSRTADAAKRFLAATPTRRVHFQPTASLHELVGIVRAAALVVSPDTSVVHVAAAERTPLVGLYEHFPHQWRPSHQPSRVVTPPHGQPVSAISIEAVVEACRAVLADTGRRGREAPRVEPC